jgi:hypothetical protein
MTFLEEFLTKLGFANFGVYFLINVLNSLSFFSCTREIILLAKI